MIDPVWYMDPKTCFSALSMIFSILAIVRIFQYEVKLEQFNRQIVKDQNWLVDQVIMRVRREGFLEGRKEEREKIEGDVNFINESLRIADQIPPKISPTSVLYIPDSAHE